MIRLHPAFREAKKCAKCGASNNVAGADALLTDAADGLFDTEDARGGIRSF
jgi:hypothetical protein